jgi:2-iminobutanoate/2-iminopropanoate deaminase
MVKMNSPMPISTNGAPSPVGHYSQAVAAGDLIFVSGQLPITANGNAACDASFAEQARLALANVLSIVRAAGSDRDHIVKTTAYVVGISNWAECNRIYAEVLGSAKPARSIVPVPELHHGCLIEVDAIAVRARPSS